MNSYRLYMMERGHIRAAHDLAAASDEDALALADELRGGEPAELWLRDRLVATFRTQYEQSA